MESPLGNNMTSLVDVTWKWTPENPFCLQTWALHQGRMVNWGEGISKRMWHKAGNHRQERGIILIIFKSQNKNNIKVNTRKLKITQHNRKLKILQLTTQSIARKYNTIKETQYKTIVWKTMWWNPTQQRKDKVRQDVRKKYLMPKPTKLK